MIFKRFRLIVTGRILLLAATLLLVVYLVLETSMYATITIVIGVAAYQTYSLIAFMEKSNRNLMTFLQSIEYSDFSQTFSGGMRGRSFDELNAAFSDIMTRFRQIRSEKEESFRYLQTVVQHVGVGMLAFTPDGKVQLMNTSAKRLLGIPHLHDIAGLEPVSKPLLKRLQTIKPGQRDLVTVSTGDEMLQLSLYATELRQQDKRITLVSFQNISSELNEKEMEAWQNLVRVLTHEIKNSLTPIGSLAATVEGLLLPTTSGESSEEDREDIRQALQTIQKRSYGLLQFVDTYRDLTHIPKPEFEVFRVKELIGRIERLIEPQLEQKKIAFSYTVEPQAIELMADPQLVEQVLINLLLNAIQALDGQDGARIDVTARIDDRSRIVVKVTDNGPGIVEEALERVFVPFFTTRKSGSGIGLSLSRQIMRLHRGDLTVRSEPQQATTFTMRF